MVTISTQNVIILKMINACATFTTYPLRNPRKEDGEFSWLGCDLN